MLQVGIGQAEGIDSTQVTREALAQCRAQLGAVTPQVVLALSAGDFDFRDIAAAVRAAWPAAQLVGCTTSGDFSSQLSFSEDSVALLALAATDLVLATGVLRQGDLTDADPQALRQAVRAALSAARPAGAKAESLCLLFPSGLSLCAEQAIEFMQAELAPGCALFGGLAGLPWSSGPERCVQLYGDEVLRGAMPFVLFCGELDHGFSLSNSWTPVGSRQAVTRARGRTIYRIGERSALDFYRYYLGSHSRPAFEFPLAVYTGDGDGFALRVPIAVDVDTGAIQYTSTIPEGAIVQITEVVRAHMLDQISGAMTQAHAQLQGQPAVALAFSCATRRQILGSHIVEEMRLLQRHLPPAVPLLGFYAMGEIAPIQRGDRALLHSSSLVTLILGSGLPAAAPLAVRAPATGAASSGPASGFTSDAIVARAQDYAQLLQNAQALDPVLLPRRLARTELSLRSLEETKDLSSAMLRTINAEIDAARRLIEEQNATLQQLYAQLAQEKRKSEELLLNILPVDVAEELKRTGHVEPVYYPQASVLFTDFTGFTHVASRMTPAELIAELDFYFSAFDRIIERHGLEKLKTIGDAYMAAGGVPVANTTHAIDAAGAAWELQRLMEQIIADKQRRGQPHWQVRIGINTGPLMAGVIGQKKFAYDIWGNTVNIAARLESTSEPGRINISAATYELIKHRFRCEPRGKITAKNAGEIEMYFIAAEA